jgi:preprotein translocase subunit SecE
MARDRQRAKQRRRRQSGAATRARNPRAREIGLDDASVEESGLGGATPTPNPLDHASADVDEALMAEAGPAGFADEVEDDGRAPDIAEDDDRAADIAEDDDRAPDIAEDRPEALAAGVRGETVAPRRAGPFGRILGFLMACWAELQRVQWPDRRQVGQGTAVVLGFVILAGAYLGLLDAILSPLIQKIL